MTSDVFWRSSEMFSSCKKYFTPNRVYIFDNQPDWALSFFIWKLRHTLEFRNVKLIFLVDESFSFLDIRKKMYFRVLKEFLYRAFFFFLLFYILFKKICNFSVISVHLIEKQSEFLNRAGRATWNLAGRWAWYVRTPKTY